MLSYSTFHSHRSLSALCHCKYLELFSLLLVSYLQPHLTKTSGWTESPMPTHRSKVLTSIFTAFLDPCYQCAQACPSAGFCSWVTLCPRQPCIHAPPQWCRKFVVEVGTFTILVLLSRAEATLTWTDSPSTLPSPHFSPCRIADSHTHLSSCN